ncbi:SPOSA6832_00288 [Sporobolomyces salmonicolor]|uniref:SPOSA6832_00288-mRNA-1:cds n=1 Tax=Sporidiobolus salmonicolor TaxID=5005 RepID=A0A0D6EGD7_SPOSA|nr:SPOSA6832_00288 [Sporobolomyces salmonicolor]
MKPPNLTSWRPSSLRHLLSSSRSTRLLQRPPTLWISVIKATIALSILLILTFSNRSVLPLLSPVNPALPTHAHRLPSFALLSPHPAALNGAVLVIVGAYPGSPMGKCFQALLLGGAGLSCGVLVYAILGWCSHSPTGQGFVFALYVYLSALVRFSGAKYISFYLVRLVTDVCSPGTKLTIFPRTQYGVLFAFNGIYTSIISGHRFDKEWLVAELEAYAWGMAIALCVNLLVWPITSEQELRKLLVTSLQHVSTLAHLSCKTYAKEINEDEIEVRQLLIRTIRSDYLALTARLDETSLEVLYTRWSLKHYSDMISAVQGLQQALITSSSALDMMDRLDPHGVNVKRHLLARAETARTFADFRRGIDLVIAEIIDELVGPSAAVVEPTSSSELGEQEQGKRRDGNGDPQAPAAPELGLHTTPTTLAAQKKLETVAAKLKREVKEAEGRHQRIWTESIRSSSLPRRNGLHGSRSASPRGTPRPSPNPTPPTSPRDSIERERERWAASVVENLSSDSNEMAASMSEGEGGRWLTISHGGAVLEKAESAQHPVQIFKKSWEAFARAQGDALVRLIKDGALQVDDVLRIEEGMPSLKSMYADRQPRAWTSSLIAQSNLQRVRSHETTASHATTDSNATPPEGEVEVPCSEALTKSYSLLFGFGQLTEELCKLHDLATLDRPRRLRFFMFRTFANRVRKLWAPKDQMDLQEALATLHGKEYKPIKKSWIRYIADWEAWLRSQRSSSLGAACFMQDLIDLLSSAGMISSLITIIVAIAPTLGGTLTTWLLQISGTGAGALVGLIVLEIFKDVGGYRYNPYGLVAFGALWFAFASYWFYKYPAWYTMALLLSTGYGGLTIQEYVYNETPGSEEHYDSPPLRFGYTIASLGISMGISAIFQLLIIRQPARRRLRLQLASVTFSLSAYNSLLQSYVNIVAPVDAVPPPSPEALTKVQRELIKREIKIQSAILGLASTYEFAKVEPKFLMDFKADVLLKIMRNLQVVLDRLREARTAVGLAGFNPTIHQDFASVLYPYRLHSQRLTRTLFYLGATSCMPSLSACPIFLADLLPDRTVLSKTQLARDVPSSKSTWAFFERDALVLARRMGKLPQGDRELKQPGFLRYWMYLVSLAAVSSELEELEKQLGDLFGDPDLHHPAIH